MDVPRPNWELSSGHEVVANVLFGVVGLLALGYCVHLARRDRTRWPLFVFLGSGLAVFYEPINNVLGHCTYPEISQVTWISTLGRRIPTYIGPVYFFYFSAPILWLMGRIRAGVTTRQWWTYYSVGVVACTCFELIPIHYGWWKYYGANQGLRVLGFSMWWWFANPMCLFAMAALFHFLREQVLTDRLSPLLVVLWPMALFATHGSAAVPVYTALNSTANTAVTSLAVLLTIGLALMVVALTGKLVAIDARRPAAEEPTARRRGHHDGAPDAGDRKPLVLQSRSL
ncbi:MAG TPA: hypothetical protein VJ456_07910 [Acidimicrobiia bacterium]|nr:hypothetical protein [Acidimicrobiia bacterium]